MNTLQLTSPLTRGWEVRNLQLALNDNPFGDFLQGSAVDGEFGPFTAQAVHRAKYWLGYMNLDNVAGPYLREYLAGKRQLTPLMKVRRAYRLRKRAWKPMRLKALEAAISQIGQRESPYGSNISKFTQWYGMNRQPWCAMFVTWCYVLSGSKAFVRGQKYAYCPYVVDDARHGRNNLTLTRNPQPGDVVLFDWDNDGVADHIGLFRNWIGPGQVNFATVEGNTSAGSNSNGGQVQARTRLIGDVVCFVHVGG